MGTETQDVWASRRRCGALRAGEGEPGRAGAVRCEGESSWRERGKRGGGEWRGRGERAAKRRRARRCGGAALWRRAAHR